MHPMLNIAVKAARRAGALISRASLELERIAVDTKSPNDFVTDVDRAAEAAIIDVLREAFPEHAILAEEAGRLGPAHSPYCWIIDPLDGTTNFIHGLPHFAVSIALEREGLIEQAVIFDLNRNELFTASKGQGAFVNDRRMRVSKRVRLSECLIGTGFPFRATDDVGAYLAMLRELIPKTAGVRRPGAASLDLAWVACGRLDGFWEMGLSSWDMAAGALLIQEAGGLVADLDGESAYLETGGIVAAPPKVFGQLLPLLQAHRPSGSRV